MTDQRKRTVDTIAPAVPRPLGYLMLAVTVISILLLFLGLVAHLA